MDEAGPRRPLSRRTALRTALAGATAGATASAVATDASAQGSTTVEMTDSLEFQPASLEVAPGTTVVWETVGSTPHSVTAYEDEIPDDAEYFASGGFGSESEARSAYPDGAVEQGETYEQTFDAEGEYGYFCIPHEGAGMVASLTVSADAGGGGGNATAVGPPQVTDAALSLTLGIMAAMGSIFGLVFFFTKYQAKPDGEE